MASLPTGSDELIYIGTSKISFIVKGPACHPKFQKAETAEPVSQLRVYCEEEQYKIELLGAERTGEIVGAYAVMPLFYEQQRYELVIEGLGDDRVEFWHDSINVRNKVTPLGRQKNRLSGVICFGNEIGFSDLVVRVNGREHLRVTVEVYPTKISYKEDYQAIVKDITAEVYNLIFDVLKKTYLSYRQNRNVSGSFVEFFAIIRKIYADLVRAVDMILARPHHQLENIQAVLPSYKIRQCSNHTLRWLERHPEHVMKGEDGWKVDRASAIRKRGSYDTRENRLTKFILKNIARKIGEFRKRYQRLCTTADEAVLKELDSMSAGIVRRCSHGFLQEVNEGEAAPEMSLVFTMAPGYRELYKYYLMLLHGLALSGDVFNISVKDMALLYEYWCFIKLNSIMRNSSQYELVSQDVVHVQNSGLYVTLTKGRASSVRYRNSRTGEKIILSYNPKKICSATVAQKPDNVLSLKKEGKKIPYRYVFDAKYRINPALPGTDYYEFAKSPGPETDDINTMHRYRDAIVFEHGKKGSSYKRTMFGAYVLFPYHNEEEYRKHRFYQSIDKVNIGGLPFLPSATSMVEEMLNQLIADSPDSAFERATLPAGIEEKLAKVDWSKRDVLVGSLRSREQLKICLENHFYYIPASRLMDDDFPVHYVAIYQSKNLFGETESGVRHYGEVTRYSLVPRREITEIPKESNELYYRFEIRKWKELPTAIQVKERGDVRMFTNEFLLHHGTEVPELRIRSGAEYRFYEEMKRISKLYAMEKKEENELFSFGDYMFSIADDQIVVSQGKKNLEQYSVSQFIRHPNTLLRIMKKDLKLALEE